MLNKKYLSRGVVDPITIIGVLFLITTLIVGTYVITNKKYDFNIFEKAAILECFPAGTKITTVDGNTKNIEDFNNGDLVLSENIENGQKVTSKTTKLWNLYSFDMCSVEFEDGDTLKLTSPHPLFTKEGWKAINEVSGRKHNPELTINKLSENDYIKKQDGSWSKVTDISCKYGLFKVYNLAVDTTNNYFAQEYLVHNKKTSVVDKGAGTTTVLDEGGKVIERTEKVIDRENNTVTVIDTTNSLPSQVISTESPAYVPPVTVPEVSTTKTEETTTGGSCTALCLQNASIDECLCTSKQIQDLGIVVPSQAYLDQNGSPGNDGKFLENGSEIIVPGSIADIPPISPAKPPAPVRHYRKMCW